MNVTENRHVRATERLKRRYDRPGGSRQQIKCALFTNFLYGYMEIDIRVCYNNYERPVNGRNTRQVRKKCAGLSRLPDVREGNCP